MKTPTTTTAPPTTYHLDLPGAAFHHLEETASRQGFPDVPAMIAHACTAYAWPADRWQIIGEPAEFKKWNRAAFAERLEPETWIRKTLNTAASAREANPPLQLPAPIAAKLRAMAAAAGIEGGADAFAAAVLGDILEDTAADFLIDGWEITDPATIANLYQIQSATA